MLVLNRKKGEAIIIGNDIQIYIVEVQGDNIKIGIEAPREVSIYRKEIYEEIVEANRQAASQPEEALSRIKEMKGKI
ncbi:carbon storage regulator [hydrocarbon metagenome]|uniref:Carbon storage regulator n=1 Tax=hydrocarbon metagenome TaxID=938273 RepID=A0A0W8E1H7_9ZZZZ